MAYSQIVCLALVAVFCVFSANAQQSTGPQPCQNVQGMTGVNATQFVGLWYETSRAPASNVGCIQVNVELNSDNATLSVTTMNSASLSSTYMNQQANATVNITDVNTNTGFNVAYNNANAVNTTYKIINTDYTSYAVVCGYTSSNASTSFGSILTRSRNPNNTLVGTVVNNTALVLANFNSSLVTSVPQQNCYASSASTSVPILSSLFAAFYLLVKFLN